MQQELIRIAQKLAKLTVSTCYPQQSKNSRRESKIVVTDKELDGFYIIVWTSLDWFGYRDKGADSIKCILLHKNTNQKLFVTKPVRRIISNTQLSDMTIKNIAKRIAGLKKLAGQWRFCTSDARQINTPSKIKAIDGQLWWGCGEKFTLIPPQTVKLIKLLGTTIK